MATHKSAQKRARQDLRRRARNRQVRSRVRTAVKEVRDLIGSVVAEVNREFARVEQIKDFRLIDVLLTAEDEELTATMKLKRSFVEKKHRKLIDEMYAA